MTPVETLLIATARALVALLRLRRSVDFNLDQQKELFALQDDLEEALRKVDDQ